MGATFGPSGNSERFYQEKHKKTLEAFVWLKNMGLDAFEYPAGNGITASLSTFSALGEESFYIYHRVEKVVEVADNNVA